MQTREEVMMSTMDETETHRDERDSMAEVLDRDDDLDNLHGTLVVRY